MRIHSRLSVLSSLLMTTLCSGAQISLPTEAIRPSSGTNGTSSNNDVRTVELAARLKMQLIFLPGGTFEMGDWGNEQGLPYDGEENSRPLHKVALDGFSMMAYKVSYEDFDLFTETVGEQPIDQDPRDAKSRMPHKPAGANWYGAKAYCGWLAQLTGLPFDLPTEAQWEYAARSGGKKVIFATDNGKIDKDRNYPWDIKDRRTPDLGAYPPNPAGLYGMADLNASEWVNDWYDPDYYKHSPGLNPKGPEMGQPAKAAHPEFGPAKVIRGHSSPGNSPAFGGFVFSRGTSEPKEVRSERRSKVLGYSGWSTDQFRCAVNQSKPVM